MLAERLGKELDTHISHWRDHDAFLIGERKERLLRNSEKRSKAKITFKNFRQFLPLKRTFFINNNCFFPKHPFHWNSTHIKENIIFSVKICLSPHISLIWECVGRSVLKETPKRKTHPLPFLNTQIYPDRQNYSGPCFTTSSWLGRSVKQVLKKKRKGNPTCCYIKIWHSWHQLWYHFYVKESIAYFDSFNGHIP